MRTVPQQALAVVMVLGLASLAWSANDGVQENAVFPEVDISFVVAKRSAVAEDEGTKAAHLDGMAEAERSGDTLNIHEPAGGDADADGDGENEEDGFIVLTQNNPGKSKNTDVPRGHLSNMTLTLVNNTFEGEGIFVFDSDGDGVGFNPDTDDDGEDFNGDEIDDDDQVIPVRVRVNHRSNAKTDFLQGTAHNSLEDSGSIGGEAAEATDQPRVNGRIRSSRHASEE